MLGLSGSTSRRLTGSTIGQQILSATFSPALGKLGGLVGTLAGGGSHYAWLDGICNGGLILFPVGKWRIGGHGILPFRHPGYHLPEISKRSPGVSDVSGMPSCAARVIIFFCQGHQLHDFDEYPGSPLCHPDRLIGGFRGFAALA